MTYLYAIASIDTIPAGVEYRILFEDGDKPMVIQTKTEAPAFTVHPQKWPNGIDCVDDGCLAEWRTRDKEIEAVDAEIEQAVNKMAELSTKYPAKVSARLKTSVDKVTTEGLLRADGADVTINVNGNWKK